MYFIIIIALIPIFLLVDSRNNLRKLRIKIREEFGKKPKIKEEDWKRIKDYWEREKEFTREDERIDDITWDDLDMNKIFSRINNCQSYIGEQVLYGRLHQLPIEDLPRESLEKKILFFTENEKEREDVQLLLNNLGKNKDSYYLPSFIANLDSYKIANIWKYKLMQGLLVLSVLPAIILGDISYLILSLIIFIINIAIYVMNKMKYESNLNSLKNITNILDVSKKISNSKKFSYGKEFTDLKDLNRPFKKLLNILSLLQSKKDSSASLDVFSIIYDYIIGGTLWEFTKYDRVIDILKEKEEDFKELYRQLGEIDMAISLVSFRESIKFYSRPIFKEENKLQMKEIYHPLIDEAVCNTIDLGDSSIVTGSNASGKSTYIKAVAVNVILGQSINTCMAREMIMPHGQVITSMAVRDDLMAGESYFIREIRYLKRIIESLSEERIVICLIDEILRGTNTKERIAASVSILNYLKEKNCITIVASHDIELTEILSPSYDNYHFTEEIREKDIIFNYKIYNGPSNSRNAIRLLEYVGFPEEIVDKAKELAIL